MSVDPNILDTPLDQMEWPLSSCALHAAKVLNCRTIGDLSQRTVEEIVGVYGVGLTTVREIRHRLGRYGLALRGESVLK
jgi:DNA-directed RNA polymerase alpha subunit